MFDFRHVQPFDKSMIHSHSPMVLFATPGMLHGGLSLAVFKEWCTDEKNALIIPGYCTPGTVGNMLLSGIKQIEIDNKWVQVKCEVLNMSFSAHADAKGILKLMQHVQPEQVILLHGEKETMSSFSSKIKDVIKVPIHIPENNKAIELDVIINQKIGLSLPLYEILRNAKHQIRSLGLNYGNVDQSTWVIIGSVGTELVARECEYRKTEITATVMHSVKYSSNVSKDIAKTIKSFKEKIIE